MIDQIIISVLFCGLLFGLIFTDWPAVRVFTGTMLITYFLGLVGTEEILAKATNTGLMTLVMLLLVSIGLEKLAWLNQLSHNHFGLQRRAS